MLIVDDDLPRVERNLDKVAETAQLALREMRSLLFELQPPSLEEGGLAQKAGGASSLDVPTVNGRTADADADAPPAPSVMDDRELNPITLAQQNDHMQNILKVAEQSGTLGGFKSQFPDVIIESQKCETTFPWPIIKGA